jgi:16S rRNA (guanine527-N7)-methyltransferase
VTGLAETPEGFARQFNVSRESLDRLIKYGQLLASWQERINLVGRSTASDIWQRHITDALQLILLFEKPLPRIADLGSGAGIPGLILAIARPLEAHLFESNLKKAAFLREAVRLTGAAAHIHAVRIEDADTLAPAIKADIVTARALAPLPKLLAYAQPFFAQGAAGLFHKGQDVDAELSETAKSWSLNVVKHPSMTDSRGCILEVKEAHRVK